MLIYLKDSRIFIKVQKEMRIKEYLYSLNIFSSNLINRVIKNRDVAFADGKKIGKNRKIKKGEEIAVFIGDRELSDYKPIKGDLEIIYEDDLFLIINKQPNEILFYTSTNDRPCIASYVQQHFIENDIVAKIRFVNRLDRDTSGILIIAKSSFAHNFIFQNHIKTYYGISQKYYRTSCVINHSLLRRMPYTYICDKEGKRSLTRFRQLLNKRNYSLIAFKLLTGRTHQIRAHMSYEGFPLVGDKGYGGLKIDFVDRQLLHCGTVSFLHPISRKRVRVRAPFKRDFKRFIDEFMIKY
ncbi:MAG: hypothetical protein C0601_06725 [Candidatus Muiribacterium halophilum]|uniref:Pseudouridine synthase RsuA/RluA-like domain-containing protein n=1 Tax=Muiribacterium halophilum TaxID=2053465 RepID=A0A2N5ZGD8_MUIH1|nr:MAG: hypothetical protein C0601_06725 [Candidatus Muirbacterium halophilum]